MVVAVAALVVALVGMPAAYAIGIGEVKTRNLADGAVTTPKIAADAVTAAKVRAGAIGSPEIANGSVGFADLAGRTTVATIATTPSGTAYQIPDSETAHFPLAKASWTQAPGEVDLLLVEYVGKATATTSAYFGVSVRDSAENYVGGGQGTHDFYTVWNRNVFPGFEYEAQSGSAIAWVGATSAARTLTVDVALREDGPATSTIEAKDVRVYVLRLR
jgi:hypothetical protein